MGVGFLRGRRKGKREEMRVVWRERESASELGENERMEPGECREETNEKMGWDGLLEGLYRLGLGGLKWGPTR